MTESKKYEIQLKNIPISKTEKEIKTYFKSYITKTEPISMTKITQDEHFCTWTVQFRQKIGEQITNLIYSNITLEF